jgi:uncharacterized protein (TIGR03437 family)
MPLGYGPVAFASAVLPDGRAVVIGGEYEAQDNCTNIVETAFGAIYDPVASVWTAVRPPAGWQHIGDAPSVVLPDGRFLLGHTDEGLLARLEPDTLTWTPLNGSNKYDSYYGEEGWTLLPSGNFLTVDTYFDPVAEIYSPGTDLWSLAGNTTGDLAFGSSPMTDIANEMGPAILRPDGTVFAMGASGHTSIYNIATGKWSAGPDFPKAGGVQLAVADGPAALLPNGNVLMGASPFELDSTGYPDWVNGTQYFEFDGKQLNAEPVPQYASLFPTYVTSMLPLPSGQVLLLDTSTDVEVYTSAGQANPSWAPTIASAPTTLTGGSRTATTTGRTYVVTGTQFNGLSQAASFGDDNQQATNYPLVRITNSATGHVFYCRTHNHSTMAIATGAALESTQFDVPSIETGPSTLVVVANGIASAAWPVNVVAPVTGPELTVTSTHSGSFTQGQIGATYTIALNDFFATPGAQTSGVITITDTLPAGLTATAMSGSGWTCDAVALRCTRSDSRFANNPYPPITLTVNVSSNAPGIAVNLAVVAGGGDVDTSDNSITDPTIINAAPLAQTITFAALADIAIGKNARTRSIGASVNSALTLTFSSTTPSVCTVPAGPGLPDGAGNTFTSLSIAAVGTCSITATQSGDAIYAAATPLTVSFKVNPNAQTITFGALNSVQFGVTPIALNATASSGLTVVFTSTTNAVCTVNGATLTVVTPGFCSITATQPGNATYGAAPPVTQGFNVTSANGNPTPQTIALGPLTDVTFGVAPFTVSAIATSALTVTLTSTPPTVCTVSGTTITITGGGSCTITANQGGNGIFAAAAAVTGSFNVIAAAGGPVVPPGAIGSLSTVGTPLQAGGWVNIYGSNLAATTAMWNNDFPTSLGGVTVTINGKRAYLLYVSPGQIDLMAPDDNTTGNVYVTVTNASGSWTLSETLLPASPSFSLLDGKHVAGIILRQDGSGTYAGGAYDIIGPTGTSLGYSTVAARQEDVVELFGVGFGPTSPIVPAGQLFSGAAPTTSSLQLQIGGASVSPFFAGLSSAGLYQINVTIPAGLGTGDQSLVGIIGGAQTQSGIVISLQ